MFDGKTLSLRVTWFDSATKTKKTIMTKQSVCIDFYGGNVDWNGYNEHRLGDLDSPSLFDQNLAANSFQQVIDH